MKRAYIGIVAVLGVSVAVGLQAQQQPPKMNPKAHLGTWQLKSYKYGENQQAFTEFPPTERRIKLITETHFTWIGFNADTKKIRSSAGGKYTLDGNTYTESIDFGLEMDTYLGQKHAFTIQVDGDRFTLSGSLADNLKIEEVWQRVK
jgi:hypothetical protein